LRALFRATRLHADEIALDLELDFVGRREMQLALRAFDGDRLTFQLGGHAGGNGDGLLADSRHG
jgi:hypothetical protein